MHMRMCFARWFILPAACLAVSVILGGCCRVLPGAVERCPAPIPCAPDPARAMGASGAKATTDKSLFLYCGAGIRKPVAEINRLFERQTGVRIEPTFTGSGCALAQIEMADKGDLFMPGEDWFMEQAVERGRILERREVAHFVPVIMVQRGNPHGIKRLDDLLKPGVRVGLGEPKACAIGHFTVKLMEAEGVSWEGLQRNVVAQFATAPELGNAVKLKAVDACVQWDSIAALYLDDAEVVPFPVDERTSSPITLGILKTTSEPELARDYLGFVAGPEGQRVFTKHHFTLSLDKPTFPWNLESR